MTKIVEGRMIVTRINLRIPPMKGEAIVREPESEPQQQPQQKE